MTGLQPNRTSVRTGVPCLALAALGLLILLSRPVLAQDGEPPASQPEAAAGQPGNGAEPAADTGKPAAPAGQDDLRWEVEGYLRQEFRFRHVDGDDDLDAYTYVVETARYRGKIPFLVRVNGRLVADLVGDQQESDLLRDVWDGFDHDVQFRLYEAFVETDKLIPAPLTLRGGRQFLDEGTYFHFDGIRADYDLGKIVEHLDASAVFGVPVKFGEPNRSESWFAGLVLRGKVAERTRARLEYYHVSEFFEGINPVVVDPLHQPVSVPATNLDDDYFGLTIWHRLQDNLRLFGRFSLLNGDANELHLRIRWFTEDGKWTVVAEWYQLFERLRNVTNELTPFVPMMGTYQPFFRVSVRATYRPADDWVLQAGYSRRQLESGSDEGVFNHEYDNYYGSATWMDLLEDRLDLTFLVNGFSSSLNDVVALGGHADFRLDDRWQISGGIDYQLFKYDFFQNTEREDVWTYSVRARWKWKKNWTLRGGISIDNDRFETYTEITVDLTVRW